jgi:biotin synthase
MLRTLANLDPQPESVPINLLVPIKGTPLEGTARLDGIEFVRTIAVARLLMPKAFVRLSAGRESMSDEMQALCFFAGANSAFIGDKLLTAPNAEPSADQRLFARLGLSIMAPEGEAERAHG